MGLEPYHFYCAECLGILEPQPPGTLGVCPRLYRDYFIFHHVPTEFHVGGG